MPNRFVQLTPDVFDQVQTGIDSGRYNNASDVLRAALHALHREHGNSAGKSLAGSIAEGDVFRKLWENAVQSQSPLARG